MYKTIKILSLGLLAITILFVLFLLFETKDEINANPTNAHKILNTFCNNKKLAGFAVSVFDADSVLYSNGFGYSDMANKQPYTTNTQQYVASISKTSIGIGLMKCVEMGLFNLDDPISEHLPFKLGNPNYASLQITIRQLATHTSSLDYNEKVVESLYIQDSIKNESLDRFMNDYFVKKRYGAISYTNHAPGTNWNYSNIGAGLAAYIIEYKTGLSFAQFSQKHIFHPLKMMNTSWYKNHTDSMLHTRYYESSNVDLQEVSTSGVILYPCRDMITNVKDLTSYCQALAKKDDKLLNPHSYKELLSPNIPPNVQNMEDDNNGIFFVIDRNEFGITYQLTGLSGSDNCISTMMYFDPYTKLGYIFMGNTGMSKYNRSNHILIYRTLVSLGDNLYLNNKNHTFGQKMQFRWHNMYNRVKAFF